MDELENQVEEPKGVNENNGNDIELEDVVDSVDTYFTPQVQNGVSDVKIVDADLIKKTIIANTEEFVVYEDENLESCTKRYIEMALLKLVKDDIMQAQEIDSEEFLELFAAGESEDYIELAIAQAEKDLIEQLGDIKSNPKAKLELAKLEMKLREAKEKLQEGFEKTEQENDRVEDEKTEVDFEENEIDEEEKSEETPVVREDYEDVEQEEVQEVQKPVKEEKPKLSIMDVLKKDAQETQKYKQLHSEDKNAIVIDAKDGIDQETFLRYAYEYAQRSNGVDPVVHVEGVYLKVSSFPTVELMMKEVEAIKTRVTQSEIKGDSTLDVTEASKLQNQVRTEVENVKTANQPETVYDLINNAQTLTPEQNVQVQEVKAAQGLEVDEVEAAPQEMDANDIAAFENMKDEAFKNSGRIETISNSLIEYQQERDNPELAAQRREEELRRKMEEQRRKEEEEQQFEGR